MVKRIRHIYQIVSRQWLLWWLLTVALVVGYYAIMLIAATLKFQQWPNYVNTYSWFDNVDRIIASTPSWKDTLFIIKDEWILEVGYMNYDYGIGLSQWSLYLMPVKILGVGFWAAMLATLYLLLRQPLTKVRDVAALRSGKVMSGVGASCVATASISLSWVVCCSTPTWVVGLAMMGMGASTALWLEPLGIWLNILGYFLMAMSIVVIAGQLQKLADQ